MHTDLIDDSQIIFVTRAGLQWIDWATQFGSNRTSMKL